MTATGSKRIVSWLGEHIHLRSAEGYCNRFGLGYHSAVVTSDAECTEVDNGIRAEDETLLSSLTFSEEVHKVQKDNDDISVHNKSFTPEGQLQSLLVYSEMSSLYIS